MDRKGLYDMIVMSMGTWNESKRVYCILYTIHDLTLATGFLSLL
jgi:hypothetical protein